MNAVFADTFVFLAMLTPGSFRHVESVRWLSGSRRPLMMTEWILTELADGPATIISNKPVSCRY